MSIDFDDLVLKPCIDALGRNILYHNKNGQSVHLNAVFDDVTRFHDPILGMDAGNSGIVGSRVVIGIRLNDLPFEPDTGDRVTINDLDYYVQEVQKDGQGGAHLILNDAEV
ncbi:unnamed protein product [Commensalibacter communis]|uniref:Uncharacterized protein n=1 Tax=Commensalibacter communis TaxID=2972786 RepID=A0A9W4TQV7_9PROT|nr:hypothetical protein [Commensalibacter communis]CAI3953542.1 unnamed protein product [Commensalibacter communis]CAI3956667.1 unnamed protein product [Commensalibacter communis]